jgi:hypothetical protein
MGRGLGIVGLISSLAIVAALMAMNMSQSGPTSQAAKDAEAQATGAAGTINFTQAALELGAFHAENGTYLGAALPPSFGVTLVRADVQSYCLQSGIRDTTQHFLGPTGPPAAGPC